MVELVVLQMPHCSRECLILQDYHSIEEKYFERDSRVQWSDFRRASPDRWGELWRRWEEHNCTAYVERLRNTCWLGADHVEEDDVPTQAIRFVQCTCA